MRHIFLPLGLACLLGLTALPSPVEAADLSQTSTPIDINHRLQDWKDYGGARLYWLSVAQPRQIRMGGVPFVDPASHPLLNAPEKTPPRRSKRRASRKATTAPAVQTAPKDAASPALRPPTKPVASSGQTGGEQAIKPGSVPIEQSVRRPRGGRVEVTTEVPRPVAPVSGGPWAPVPGTPAMAGLGLYDGSPQAIPAIIPQGSLPPGTATSPAMTPPVPAQPAAAPAVPAPLSAPAAAPAAPGAATPLAPTAPPGVYSPQTVPGTPLPPLPGSAAAQPMPPQGTSAMLGTQAGQTARSGS